jgi:translation initiation factor 2B subunit (eIF-2B alpha/beta/delta family)
MLDDVINRLLQKRLQAGVQPPAQLTPGEKRDLLQIAKKREQVSKLQLAQHGAQLLVNLDKELDATYTFDQDEIWRRAHDMAEKAIEEAQAIVETRSRELGLPARFAPRISGGWISRGEQAFKERRRELRAMGQRLVDAMIKAGKARIEESSLNVQTQIMTIGFSEEAKAILDAMPTPEQLMPPLQLAELEKMLDSSPGHRHLSDY